MGCDQDGLAFLPGGSGSFDPEPGRWPSGRRFVPHWTSGPRAARHCSAVAITTVPDAAAVARQEEESATRMAKMQRALDEAVRQSEAAGREADVAALVESRMLIEPPHT